MLRPQTRNGETEQRATQVISPVIGRMQTRIRAWEEASDGKALFLKCYMLMTSNMLSSIERQEFNDCDWVNQLLHHFAGYYFKALEAYERGPDSSPAVWRVAFDVAGSRQSSALQKLLLGVSAHINYDLVLTLYDMLHPEWSTLSERQRMIRYYDHCRVNTVIGNTIDAVQDEVLTPDLPAMGFFDKLLGPVDEFLISHLITDWRETVWSNATQLIAVGDEVEKAEFIRGVEKEALKKARFIYQ